MFIKDILFLLKELMESPTQGLLNQLQLLDIEKIKADFNWLENKQDDLF